MNSLYVQGPLSHDEHVSTGVASILILARTRSLWQQRL
jgi:hypothetical protein